MSSVVACLLMPAASGRALATTTPTIAADERMIKNGFEDVCACHFVLDVVGVIAVKFRNAVLINPCQM